MAIASYMFTIADTNHNFKLDKCEHLAGCIATHYDDVKDIEYGKPRLWNAVKECVKGIDKSHKKSKNLTFQDIGASCAKRFPTLEGSPLPHDDELMVMPSGSEAPAAKMDTVDDLQSLTVTNGEKWTPHPNCKERSYDMPYLLELRLSAS